MDIHHHLHPDKDEPAGELYSHYLKHSWRSSFVWLILLELLTKREAVVNRLQELEENIEPVVRLFEDPDVAEHMKKCVH